MRYLLLFFLPLALLSYSKVALVIGNAHYDEGRLTLPTTDARKIGAFLSSKGFKVYSYQNLTKSAMKRAIKAIKSKVSTSGTALFYFSGHGMEVEGENYLLPINNDDIEDEADLEDSSISLTYIIRKFQQSPSKINIIMIDACRNNPLNFNKGSKGLGAVKDDKLKDTFLVFAGATKETIPDDGLFRQKFIEYAKRPLSLGDLFATIRGEFRDRGRNGIYTIDRTVGIFKFTPQSQGSITPSTKSKYSLTIRPTPSHAKVYITNIKPHYRDGIKLPKGSYSIKVKAEDYKTKLFDIDLQRDSNYDIVLAKLAQSKATHFAQHITTIGNLMWQDEPYTQAEEKAYNDNLDSNNKEHGNDKEHGKVLNWTHAKKYCKNLSLGGYSDWRLPTNTELQKLYEERSKLRNIGWGGYTSFYWSSTTDASYTSNAWVVSFYYGNDNYYDKSNSYFVRCVRAGE